MTDNGYLIRGPAYVAFNAPNAVCSGAFESTQGILYDEIIVVFTAMGNYLAAFQYGIGRHRLWHNRCQPVDYLSCSLLQPLTHSLPALCLPVLCLDG